MSEAAKKKRTVSQRKYTRLLNALNDTLAKGDQVSFRTFSDQLKDLEVAYAELSTCTDELMQLLDDDDDELKQSDTKLAECYTSLCSVREKMHRLKMSDENATDSRQQSSRDDASGILSDILHAQQNLPRPAIHEFNGEPENYMGFITNFECHVASHCKDDTAKLSYLIQLCGPNVKSLIDHYVMELDGFEKAKQKLKEKFGQSHLIADALISNCLKIKNIGENDHDGLVKMNTLMDKCYINLSNLDRLCDIDNQETLRRLTRKLPDSMRRRWVKRVNDILEHECRNPLFVDLKKFVNEHCKIYNNAFGRDLLLKQRSADRPKERMHNIAANEKGASSQGNDDRGKAKKLSCYKCSQPHRIHECTEFLSMKFEDKRKFLKEVNRCQNCFMKHFGRCKHASKCTGEKCQFDQVYPHHEIMCAKANSTVKGEDEKTKDVNDKKEQNAEYHKVGHIKNRGGMALKTVRVKVPKANGDMVETYALLDDGSTTSFIENDLYDRLGYDGSHDSFHLDTMGHSVEMQGRKLSLFIYSANERANVYVNRLWTCDKIPATAENIFGSRDAQNWDHLKNIRFPILSGRERIQILIGANTPEAHWKLEEIRGERKQPYAVRGILGWSCLGPKVCDSNEASGAEVNFNCIHQSPSETCTDIKKLFETDFPEKIYDSKLSPSQDDIRADSMVSSSISYWMENTT